MNKDNVPDYLDYFPVFSHVLPLFVGTVILANSNTEAGAYYRLLYQKSETYSLHENSM